MELIAIIELKDGRWLVNEKPIEDLTKAEKQHLNDFFKQAKNGRF